VAVLRHDVARISELCLLALALLGEFGLGVRGRAVRLIAALLAVKMALAVAPRRWRVTRTVLRYKALHRCPSLNLRAVDGGSAAADGSQALSVRGRHRKTVHPSVGPNRASIPPASQQHRNQIRAPMSV